MLGYSHTVGSFSIYVALPSFSYAADSSHGPIRVAVPEWKQKIEGPTSWSFLHRIFFFVSVDDFVTLSSGFFDERAVYLRFSHVLNFQPKFYIGSTSSSVLDREHTRYRKLLQVQQNKFVLAKVALRFWNKYGNFWMWSVLPLCTGQSNFWALKQP